MSGSSTSSSGSWSALWLSAALGEGRRSRWPMRLQRTWFRSAIPRSSSPCTRTGSRSSRCTDDGARGSFSAYWQRAAKRRENWSVRPEATASASDASPPNLP